MKLKTVIVIGLVFGLLCGSAISAFKVGTDGTGQRWGWMNNDDGYITTDAGKAYLGTGAGLQSAINNGSTVYLNNLTITGTSVILPKSNVNVIGPGKIIITSTGGCNAVNFSSVNNSIWSDITVIRAGVVTNLEISAGLITRKTSDTLKIINCVFNNTCTGTTNQYGLYILGSTVSPVSVVLDNTKGIGGGTNSGFGIFLYGSKATLSDCTGQGGSGGIECHGIRFQGSDKSILDNCIGIGGSGGSGCYGLHIGYESSSILNGCTGKGGSGGTQGKGISIEHRSTAKLTGCIGVGGSYDAGAVLDSDNCGIIIGGASSPVLNGCTGYGGVGRTGHGIHITDSSDPVISGSTALTQGTRESSYAWSISGSSSPFISGSNSEFNKTASYWNYDDADNGRFRPFSNQPYQLISIRVTVSIANPAVTLSIGTSIGGSQIATAVDIGSTGDKLFVFNKSEVSSAGYLYATPSAPIADADIIVHYTVISNNRYNFALYINTYGYARIIGSNFVANGNSNCTHIHTYSISANKYSISNCNMETLDTLNQYGLYFNSVPTVKANISYCHIVGLIGNLGVGTCNYGSESYGMCAIAGLGTSITVNHNLTSTPKIVICNPMRTMAGTAAYWYVDTFTATQFTVHTNAAIGATAVGFSWYARV